MKKSEQVICKPGQLPVNEFRTKEYHLKNIKEKLNHFAQIPEYFFDNEIRFLALVDSLWRSADFYKLCSDPLSEFKSHCTPLCVEEEGKKWNVAQIEVSLKKKTKTKVFADSSLSAYRIFKTMWDKELINLQEQIAAIFLTMANQAVGFKVFGSGTIKSSTMDLNLLIACALQCGASRVIMAHNHPSGQLYPSKSDINITVEVKNKLKTFDIELVDHIIINDEEYYSFGDNKLIFEH